VGTATYLDRPAAEWVKLLGSADPLDRRLAAHALSEIGTDAADVLPALAALLGDPEPYIRVWAAAALARVDPDNPAPALTVLTTALEDPTHFVRSLAAWHLGRMRPDTPGIDAALPALKKLLDDDNRNVRVEAQLAWKRLHTHGQTLAH